MPRQVLLCGDSTVALVTLLELARHAWERGGLAAAAAGMARPAAGMARPAAGSVQPAAVGHVMLLDRRARDLRREYPATSSLSIIQALPGVEVHAE